ncbi:HelD family protein [Tumebacillus permanentifrigoris]|uniref:Rep family ATP-dependent DNA helicase n=1 Tax=Tumebacillus permanentifrigoris TaxID=378543 RepID=A0A316DC07_9BACL|nr:ATP-binding domain-containing protein [Tumebacillus permanentifrigoris]PWK14889.1 Rep family ATP-dependent DNA helicase [Tumebacillus permanentifrigoris]
MEEEIQSAYQQELQRLEQTAAEIDSQLQTLQNIPRYYGDDLTEQVLDNIRESQRHALAIAGPEPYFGRLDFEEEGKDAPAPLYIGKVGVENIDTGELLVIDWRAPVASMYYSFTGGEDAASYDSPDGVIQGLIYLKRNLVIRKQILQRVVDAYERGGENLAVTDEFLLYRLSENKDNKLRDIVSTIQEEQDKIIRSAKNLALVIQGVAGSGKTTVALHRLAFLLYQYRENIRAERMIIFAPNSMFLDYISSVLPELGVGGIQQTTFTDWALELLDHEIQLTDPADRLSEWFGIGAKRPVLTDDAPGRWKGRLSFLHELDEQLHHYEKTFVPEVDFTAWEGATLRYQTMQEWFYTEYKHYPLAKRRDRVHARIKRWMAMELDKVWEVHLRKDFKKSGSAKLRTFFKHWPAQTQFQLYKQFVANSQTMPEALQQSSVKLFKKKRVELEDLAPLLYIRDRLHGIESNDVFDHTVIDEAQDFSPFQVAVLKERTRSDSFTILGDLSQGIHAYQGIRDWNEFLSLFGEEASGFFRLDRSYRSTMEIIHFANVILERSGEPVTLAKPVFRSGEKVVVHAVAPDQRLETITRSVAHLLQSGDSSTVAVIARTDDEARILHEHLTTAGFEATLIHSGQRQYRGGLSVLPIYLSKGLEFDAVLLTDVDETRYELTPQDAKLLYVGCTRALHHLWLLHTGVVSPLIADLSDEIDTNVLPSS